MWIAWHTPLPPPQLKGKGKEIKEEKKSFCSKSKIKRSLATTHTSWAHFTRKTRRFSSHFLGNNSFSSSYGDIIMGDLCLRSNAPGPTHSHTPADVTCLIMSIAAVVWPRAFGGVCMYVGGWRCAGPFSNILYCVVDWCVCTSVRRQTELYRAFGGVPWGLIKTGEIVWLTCRSLAVHKIGRSQRSGRSCRLIIARRSEVGVRRRKWEIGEHQWTGSTHFRCHFVWRGLMSRARSADLYCYNDALLAWSWCGRFSVTLWTVRTIIVRYHRCFRASLVRFMGFLLIMTGQNGYRNALVHCPNIVLCGVLHEVCSFGWLIDWLIGLWNFPNVLPTILLIKERWF